MEKNKALSLLSIATRAKKIKSGEFMTENSIKSGEAYLVIIAKDASDNTKKKFKDMCSFYETDCIEFSTKENLAAAMGKESMAILSICDEGFTKSFLKKLEESDLGNIRGVSENGKNEST